MATTTLLPDAVLASSGFTSTPTAATLNADDASWATASSNNTGTDVRASLGNLPAGNALTTGANLQTASAVVRKNSASGSGTPTAHLEIWENGTSLLTGGNVNVTASSASKQTLTLTFDASILSDTTGANLEVRVVGTQTGGSPSTRASVDVGYIAVAATYDVALAARTLTGAPSLAALTAAGAATHPVTGTGNPALSALTASGAALVTVTASMAAAAATGTNLAAYSEDTSKNPPWTSTNLTRASGVSDPFGGTSATSWTSNAASNVSVTYDMWDQRNDGLTLDGANVLSVYQRLVSGALTAGTDDLLVTFKDASGNSLGTASPQPIAGYATIDGTWRRRAWTFTAPAGTRFITARLSPYDFASGVVVAMHALQLEPGTTPSAYVKTTNGAVAAGVVMATDRPTTDSVAYPAPNYWSTTGTLYNDDGITASTRTGWGGNGNVVDVGGFDVTAIPSGAIIDKVEAKIAYKVTVGASDTFDATTQHMSVGAYLAGVQGAETVLPGLSATLQVQGIDLTSARPGGGAWSRADLDTVRLTVRGYMDATAPTQIDFNADYLFLRVSYHEAGGGTITLDALTATGTGTVGGAPDITATGAPALTALTAAGAITVTAAAHGAPALAQLVAAGTAAHPVTAQAAVNLAPLTSSGALEHPVTITAAAALGELTASGAASVTTTASGAPALAALTVSGSGTVSDPSARTITGAPALGVLSASGAASVTVNGAGAPSLAALTAAGNAAHPVTATGAAALPALLASSAVSVAVTASGAPSLPALIASGTITHGGVSAQGAPSLAALDASGTIAVTATASGTPGLEALTASAAATTLVTATGSPDLLSLEAGGAAAHPVTALAAINLGALEARGTIAVAVTAAAAVTLDELQASGVAYHTLPAAGAIIRFTLGARPRSFTLAARADLALTARARAFTLAHRPDLTLSSRARRFTPS